MELRKATRADWMPLPEFEGRYSINSAGEVKSLTTRAKILKPVQDSDGYKMYVIRAANGKNNSIKAHRIVAKLFIPNPNSLPVVNHLNGNKMDAAKENLEWCTSSENEKHSYRALGKKANAHWIGAMNEKNPNAKGVSQFDKDGNTIATYPSISEANRIGGFSISKVSQVCNGKATHHKGFIWKFSSNNLN